MIKISRSKLIIINIIYLVVISFYPVFIQFEPIEKWGNEKIYIPLFVYILTGGMLSSVRNIIYLGLLVPLIGINSIIYWKMKKKNLTTAST